MTPRTRPEVPHHAVQLVDARRPSARRCSAPCGRRAACTWARVMLTPVELIALDIAASRPGSSTHMTSMLTGARRALRRPPTATSTRRCGSVSSTFGQSMRVHGDAAAARDEADDALAGQRLAALRRSAPARRRRRDTRTPLFGWRLTSADEPLRARPPSARAGARAPRSGTSFAEHLLRGQLAVADVGEQRSSSVHARAPRARARACRPCAACARSRWWRPRSRSRISRPTATERWLCWRLDRRRGCAPWRASS